MKKIFVCVCVLSVFLTGCARTGAENKASEKPTYSDSYITDQREKCMKEAGIPVERDGNSLHWSASDDLSKEYQEKEKACDQKLIAQGIQESDSERTEEDIKESYEYDTKAYDCFQRLGYSQDPWVSFEIYKKMKINIKRLIFLTLQKKLYGHLRSI
ncbi:MAG: hypothetical protein J6M18_00545 [Actinomycetaceae bacterium]|nr:hypothetical protein [Actinomycetaceae bacterium]